MPQDNLSLKRTFLFKMAKRFTDNNKWNRNWFMDLSKDDKLLWLYILDTCDPNGMFDPNWKLINFMLETSYDDIPEALSKQIVSTNHPRKVFVGDFVKFQYGDLKSTSNLHKKIHIVLKEYGIDVPIDEGSVTPKPESNINNNNKINNKSNGKVKEKSIAKKKEPKEDTSLDSIDKEFLKELQMKNLDVDVEEEFQKFKDYLSANGKKYKDYKAGFRNWVKSPLVPKTDKIREKMRQEQIRIEAVEERKRLQKMKEDGETFGPPPEWRDALKKVTKSMSIKE